MGMGRRNENHAQRRKPWTSRGQARRSGAHVGGGDVEACGRILWERWPSCCCSIKLPFPSAVLHLDHRVIVVRTVAVDMTGHLRLCPWKWSLHLRACPYRLRNLRYTNNVSTLHRRRWRHSILLATASQMCPIPPRCAFDSLQGLAKPVK